MAKSTFVEPQIESDDNALDEMDLVHEDDDIKEEEEEDGFDIDGSTIRNTNSSGESLSARARANTNVSLFMNSMSSQIIS